MRFAKRRGKPDEGLRPEQLTSENVATYRARNKALAFHKNLPQGQTAAQPQQHGRGRNPFSRERLDGLPLGLASSWT